ncbi:MAG: hypothetical protein ACYC54_10925 [Sedimentisphaerales bacterium]
MTVQHIRQVSWLVIPERGIGLKGLTIDRIKSVLRHARRYDVAAIFLHGLNICDFVSVEKYDKYARLMGNSLRKAEIEANIVYLNSLISPIKDAGFKTVLSCSMPILPHGYLKGCDNFINPFISCYPELLDADGKFFWQMLDDQVTELFQNAPNLDGLDVYLFESNFKIDNLSGASTYADKLVKLFSIISQACKRLSKTFSIMCFAHTGYENKVVRTALSRLPANDHFMVRHFTNSCDYHPYMPPNENIGKVGGHFESLEIDCAGEYWGQGRIPCCYLPYISERLAAAVRSSPKLHDVVCRVNWEWGEVFDTPNESNLYAVHKLIKKPQLTAEQLLGMWAMDKYGDKAAGLVASALSRTFEAAGKIFYMLGFWVSDHSEVPSLQYAYEHLIGYGVERVQREPETASLFIELLHPTEKTVQRVLAEKDQASDICRQSLNDIELAKVHLSQSDYLQLRSYFELELNCTRIWQLFAELLVRRQMYVNGDCSQREIVQTHLRELAQVADETERQYGSSVRPGNPNAIRTFVHDIAVDMNMDGHAECDGND